MVLAFLQSSGTGVDPVSRRAFWRLLNGVRAEGVAILYATANMDEAERCDRVGLLNAGRLERQGTPLELTLLGLILAPPAAVVAEAKALLAEESPADGGLTGMALVDWVETLLVYKLPRLSREEIRKMLDIFNVE